MRREFFHIFGFCLMLVVGLTNADLETTWMCQDWPHKIKCRDSTKIEIVNVEYEPRGGQCETREGLMPVALLNERPPLRSECESTKAFESASELCNNETSCMLSHAMLFNEPCAWQDKAILRINYHCWPSFTCPRDIVAISTQRYSKNLHRRPAAWCRDPMSETSPFFLMPWARHGETRKVYQYSTLTSFVFGRPASVYHLPVAVAGTSLVAYDGHLYYVKDRTRNLTKYNLQGRRKVAERSLDDALYHHEIEYSGLVGSSDIDLAADEIGLWAIYSTEESKGNIVLSHVSTDDLSIRATWETDIPKRDLLNTFMVCGVLYAISKESLRVYRKFDTGSNTSSELPPHVNITMPWKETTSVNYSPKDNTLYVWSTSQAIIFTLDTETPEQRSEDESKMPSTTSFVSNAASFSGAGENYATDDVKTSSSTKGFAKLEEGVTDYMTTIEVNPICQPYLHDDLLWPATEVGVVATVPCPEGARGTVTWRCVKENSAASWDAAGPDFSGCSTWTISIDEQLSQENASSMVDDIAQEFSSVVSSLKESKGMKGHDLRHATAIMREISQLAKDSTVDEGLYEPPGEMIEEKRERALQLNEALLDSGSDLVDNEMADTWKSLSSVEKREAGSAIMDTVEKSAFLVAKQEEEAIDVAGTDVSTRVVAKENILLGIQVRRVERKSNDSHADNNVTFPSEDVLSKSTAWQNISDSIKLSSEDVNNNENNGKARIVFALYDHLAELVDEATMENSSGDRAEVNSRIVSATFQSANNKVKLRKPAIITLQHIKGSNESHTCVYWNTEGSSAERWLDDGCAVVSSNWSHTVCSCNHLTSFAVLVNHRGFVLDEHATILDLLTWVGLSTSLACLAVCIVTFIYFKSLHCTRTTIHTNLCICLFISQLIFLAGIDLYEFEIACSVIAGLLHYFFLATFVWMALEGFQLYVMLIEVFERNTNIAFYYLIGYGVPAMFVGLSAGLNPNGYGTETACWLKTEVHGTMGTIGGFTPFIWAFIGPASLVALGNVVFLALTAVTLYRHGRKYIYYSKLRAIRSALRGTLALVCLLGTTWAIGILWWWEGMLILQYLFCIFNAFQGVYIFIFHCLMHNKVRYEYRKVLSQCIGDNYTDLPNSSSLTMKYSGMRRRSTQTNFSQKRKGSSIVKFGGQPPYYDEKASLKRGSSTASSPGANFKDASKFFAKEDRASMQILLTRRDSLHHALALQQSLATAEDLVERHNSFSARTGSCKYSPMKARIQSKKRHKSHVEEAAPLRRSQSERRYRGKYNAPVSEGVSRLLASAGTIDRVSVPYRYNTPGHSEESSMERSTSLRSNRSKKQKEPVIPKMERSISLRSNKIPKQTEPSVPKPPNKPSKEMKLVDKRLARFKKMQSSPQLGRSSSWNGAAKKRRDQRRLQAAVHPASSVPDLMSQLSEKIESRNVSNVLLMYLDKDGTLNRSMKGHLGDGEPGTQ